MKRFLKIVIYVVLLLALLAGSSYVFRPSSLEGVRHVHKNDKSYTGISQEKENTLDIILIGDSECVTSFSPMQFYNDTGSTSYVCGQSAQKLVETYYMLKHAFRTQSPKIVMFETNVYTKEKSTKTQLKTLLTATAVYKIPLLRYHDLWKGFFGVYKDDTDWYKGFNFRLNITPYTSGDYMQPTEETEEISGIWKYYFDKIVKLCDKHNAQLILYTMPSPKNFNMAKHNAVAKAAEEYQLPYLDGNTHLTDIGIDWNTDTMDGGDHLNYYGTQKMTAWLTSYLKANYQLTDHRQDSAYEDWNNLLQKYEQEKPQ